MVADCSLISGRLLFHESRILLKVSDATKLEKLERSDVALLGLATMRHHWPSQSSLCVYSVPMETSFSLVRTAEKPQGGPDPRKAVLSWKTRFIAVAVFVLVVYFVLLGVLLFRGWDPVDLVSVGSAPAQLIIGRVDACFVSYR